MDVVQLRLPEEDIKALDELAARLHASRSEAARAAIDEGLRVLRMEEAFQKYVAGDFTLARAAEFAGVALQRMAQVASDRGVPFYRYSRDELHRDAAEAERFLERRGKRKGSAP